MSVFKLRDQKKRSTKKNTFSNLTTIHQQKVDEFKVSRTHEDELDAKLAEVKERLDYLESLNCKSIGDLRELDLMKSQKHELEGKLHRLRSCEDMMDYYYNTADLIQEYNDMESDPSKGTVSVSDFFREYAINDDSGGKGKKTHNNKRDLLEEYLEVTRPDYIRGS